MNRIRRRIAAGAVLALAFAATAQASQDPPRAQPADTDDPALHDFDFQVGEWRVHHRVLKPGSDHWVEFEGTCNTRKVMGGAGNVEDNAFDAPSGRYRAVGLRSYDRASRQWSIWWLDGRSPTGPLDPPVRGRFEDGVGRFYSDDTLNGKPIRTRYTWSRITPRSAHWEQAYSADAGKTWATNWVMQFTRVR
ncbi:hypothetical protein [Lysobacter sp. TAB13]|uniref:hypothetical protein n=1 Tax=Lysobacter sp. TAB13 TaxID=3233065 RepID=UPI003F9C1C65